VGNLTRSKRLYLLLYPALLGLGAGALASCAGRQSSVPPQTAAARVLPPSQEMLPRSHTMPRPARKPTPPPTGSPVPATDEEKLATTEPKPPGSSPSPPTEAGRASSEVELIGLDQSAATRLFGQAAERLEEPPATVWRYKSATCELDLFFYLDLRSGRMRTLHYALKDGAGGAAQRQDCVRSLIASRAS
jgi:hypothetical protein